ncbi:glutamate-cysteine ligase-domain-containing protein [Coemansia spiralis]|nr:glutamate-cysteine ligase-domain-containing protein [Coemansia spiralis]
MTRSQKQHKQQQRLYSWQDILPRMEEIRSQATDQFIVTWESSLAKSDNYFTWHETIGYVVAKRDDTNKRILLSPRVPEILEGMQCVLNPASVGTHPQTPDTNDEAQKPLSEIASSTCWRSAHARFAMRCQPPYLHKFSVSQLALEIKSCLKERRRILKSRLQPDEMLFSISQYPLLGSEIYIDGQGESNGPLLRSALLTDRCLNPILPFTLEIGGIIDRRGSVPHTAVPIFRDKETTWPFIDTRVPETTLDYGLLMTPISSNTSKDESTAFAEATTNKISNFLSAAVPENALHDGSLGQNARQCGLDGRSNSIMLPKLTHPLLAEVPSAKNCIMLDSPLFGIGSGGVLRVALCAADLDEARILYDQLAPMSAILTALTAATPIIRGYLTARDCYWDVQCSTVDDRSAQELGLVPLTTAKGTLLKSRFGSIDTYLGPSQGSNDLAFQPEFNDCQYTYDSSSYWKMKESGVDHLLAQHVAHLFTRDIHFASERMLKVKGNGDSKSQNVDGQEHFKRFLGCNRQNVCLYPPNTRAGSGWEVELMSLEVQLTDEENAAFLTFVVLLSRVIISYRLNLYLPISLMDQNMARAQNINAVKEQLFYFRRDLFGGRDSASASSGRILRPGSGSNWHTTHSHDAGSDRSAVRRHIGSSSPDTAEYIELTIDEILNGSPRFKVTGILNIILTYLSTMRLEYDVEQELRRQLWLVRKRANGKLCTLATWMRKFVQSHPAYRQDSVVSPTINYDLLRTMSDIEEGKIAAPELLG